jgi:hypothetical protein
MHIHQTFIYLIILWLWNSQKVVKIKIIIVIFWIVTLSNDVVGYQYFGGPHLLHLQAASFFETLVPYHITTWHHDP